MNTSLFIKLDIKHAYVSIIPADRLIWPGWNLSPVGPHQIKV